MDIIELLNIADAPIQWFVIILIFVRLDMRLGQLLEWQNQTLLRLLEIKREVINAGAEPRAVNWLASEAAPEAEPVDGEREA